MSTKAHNGDMDALNADIARSRKDMASLAADLQALAQWKYNPTAADGKSSGSTLERGPWSRGRWAEFRHGLDAAGTRGLQAARSLSGEIERHPLLAGLTAFGLGFGLATLLFKRGPGGSEL